MVRLTPQTSFDGLSHRMVEFEHGEYVRYSDYRQLLEALKEMVSHPHFQGYKVAPGSSWERALTAIAKAEGK